MKRYLINLGSIVLLIVSIVLFCVGHKKMQNAKQDMEYSEPSYELTEEDHNRIEQEIIEEQKVLLQKRLDECFKNVLPALISVESNGDDKAIGDQGMAIGCLQIHPIMVREVNRIIGEEKYKLEDRIDRDKSIKMCQIFLHHWSSRLYMKYGLSEELMARLWNAGSTNVFCPKTDKYWKKIKVKI